MKSVIKPLAKSVLVPLGLTAVASAADAGSGHNTTLVISNGDMKDLLEIVKYLEKSGILKKGITEKIKNEAK